MNELNSGKASLDADQRQKHHIGMLALKVMTRLLADPRVIL
ncbi:hypothetical protein [Pelagibaculum spongiae]|nr:hypothetical protein [Pelagibaculum spongiae]